MNPDQQTNPQYVSLPSPQPTMNPLPSPMAVQNQPLPMPAQQSAPVASQVPMAPPPPMMTQNPGQTSEYNQALQPGSVFSDEQWANEARRIIAQTAGDPFTQTEQLYQLRVQYMQQMHGKELKQGDE